MKALTRERSCKRFLALCTGFSWGVMGDAIDFATADLGRLFGTAKMRDRWVPTESTKFAPAVDRQINSKSPVFVQITMA
jgi:hypothetical protein